MGGGDGEGSVPLGAVLGPGDGGEKVCIIGSSRGHSISTYTISV